MPLSLPAARTLLHTRSIVCTGHQRDDGLWDIEGHLVDVKTYDFDNHHRGEVKAGEPVHEMWLRLSIDDDMLIVKAEAATDHAPYAMCPDITSRFALLEGLRIGPGFHREVQKRVGGVKGCTHLVELLRPLDHGLSDNGGQAQEGGKGPGRSPQAPDVHRYLPCPCQRQPGGQATLAGLLYGTERQPVTAAA